MDRGAHARSDSILILRLQRTCTVYMTNQLCRQQCSPQSQLDMLSSLDKPWVPVQAAVQFSEAQQEDLMLLRRLFYGKLGVLSRSRKNCLKRMPFRAATTAAEINGRLAEVAAIAHPG